MLVRRIGSNSQDCELVVKISPEISLTAHLGHLDAGSEEYRTVQLMVLAIQQRAYLPIADVIKSFELDILGHAYQEQTPILRVCEKWRIELTTPEAHSTAIGLLSSYLSLARPAQVNETGFIQEPQDLPNPNEYPKFSITTELREQDKGLMTAYKFRHTYIEGLGTATEYGITTRENLTRLLGQIRSVSGKYCFKDFQLGLLDHGGVGVLRVPVHRMQHFEEVVAQSIKSP